MTDSILKVAVLAEELAAAHEYAKRSEDHTCRKLEFQRSRYSNRERNIVVGRVARDVVARVLRQAGISTDFEDSPPTQ